MTSSRNNLLAVALAGSFGCVAVPASAGLAPLGEWGLDLRPLDGMIQGGTTYSGFGTFSDFLPAATIPPVFTGETGNLLDIGVNGSSTVKQFLSGGSPVGQEFIEEGFLNWTGAKNPDGSGVSAIAFAAQLGTNTTGSGNFIYFEWEDLTGTVVDASGNIVFDTGAAQLGTVKLYLDDDSGSLAKIAGGDATRIELASFNVVPLSGGSGIGTDGGAFDSGTVGLTLDPTYTPLIDFLYADGSVILEDVLFTFVDVDATIATPATFFDENGDGTFDYFVQSPIEHDGSIVPATEVPEPGSLALLGVGLLGFSASAWKRRRA